MSRAVMCISLLLPSTLAVAQVSTADLDDAAKKAESAASTPVAAGVTGGTLGAPTSNPLESIGAQTTIAFNQASTFAARIGRVPIESWCSFEGIGDIAALDVPTVVEDPMRTQPAALATRMYQSLGARFTFGPNVGESIRNKDGDAEISRCCSTRASVMASPTLDEDRQQCSASPTDRCIFEAKLRRMNQLDRLASCEALGVPLDTAAQCNAAEIMSVRASRNTGIRFTAGLRLVHTNDIPTDTKKGWGFAPEVQMQYAAKSWFVFLSGALVALQSWSETAGDNTLQHPGLLAVRASGGAQLRRNGLTLAISAAVTRDRWSDDLAPSTLHGTRGDLIFQAAWALAASVTGTVQVSVTKPPDGSWSVDDAEVGLAFGPSLGARF